MRYLEHKTRWYLSDRRWPYIVGQVFDFLHLYNTTESWFLSDIYFERGCVGFLCQLKQAVPADAKSMADINLKGLQDSINLLTKATSVLDANTILMNDRMREFSVIMESVGNSWKGMNTNAKVTVTQAEAAKDVMADIAKLSRDVSDIWKMNKLMGKPYQEVRMIIEDIKKKTQELRDSPLVSGAQFERASRDYRALEVLLDTLEKKKAKFGHMPMSVGDTKEIYDILKKMSGELDSIHRKMEDLRKPTEAWGQAFRNVFGDMTPKMLTPLIQTYDRIKDIQRHATQEKDIAERYQEKGREMFAGKLSKGKGGRIGNFLKNVVTPEGVIDTARIVKMGAEERQALSDQAQAVAQMTKEERRQAMLELSGKTGLMANREADKYGGHVFDLAGSLIGTEGVPEVASGTAKGIGDIAAGGGAGGTGAMEGRISGGGFNIGGALKFMEGPGATIEGSAGKLREGFDSMIDSNQKIFDSMGTMGGMFNRGIPAMDVFQNIRQNLTPGLNLYGQTREQNLAMADAIGKFGISVSELSDSTHNIDRNIIGRAGPQGTGIAHIAYGSARLAGFDPVKGTEEVLKVMQVYRKSLEGTDEFFMKLNEDTAAAGLTTTKYLQIIDSVVDKYSDIAKSVDEVTEATKRMGNAGMTTMNQMKDFLDTFSQKTSPEVASYLFLNAKKEQFESLGESQQTDIENQAKELHRAIVEGLAKSTKGMEGRTPEEAKAWAESWANAHKFSIKELQTQAGVQGVTQTAFGSMGVPKDFLQQIGSMTQPLLNEEAAKGDGTPYYRASRR